MVRSPYIDRSPCVPPVDVAQQLLPRTCEHAAHHLLAHAVDRSLRDARVRNDDAAGASEDSLASRRTNDRAPSANRAR